MNRRQLLLFLLIAVALTFLGIFLLDQSVAAFVQRTDGQSPASLFRMRELAPGNGRVATFGENNEV